MLIRTTLLLTLSFGCVMAASAQTPAQSTLQVNNVKAVIRANGTAFDDGQAGQFIPIQSGLAQKTLVRNTGIWLAGVDPAGNLKGAVATSTLSDFQPGSLNPEGSAVEGLNKVWSVRCADIAQHLADFNDNGVINNPNTAVYAFPGRENPFFEQYNPLLTLPNSSQGLAGFFDRDQNGQYDPSRGDYPSIEVRGCPLNTFPREQQWMVFNDLKAHPSNLDPVQVELQAQYFAFKTLQPSLLDNAIFARYKIINRATELIDSCFFGIHADFDIGNPDDDFMGTIPNRHILYGYNGDQNDEGGFGSEIPVMAVDLLRGPLDENGDELSLHSSIIVNEVNNLLDYQYYNLLTGSLKDGNPAPNGGIMYPGNPNKLNEISELSAGNAPGRRVGITSYGPFRLLPGAVNELIVGYYYVHTPGATPLQNVQTLIDQPDVVQGLFDNCFAGLSAVCDITSPVAEPRLHDADLHISPNPATTAFVVESTGEPFGRIDLVDALGRMVKSLDLGQAVQQYTVSVADVPAGVYMVRVGGQVRKLMVRH